MKFDDLDKVTRDLLTKNYCYDRKLETKTNTLSGVTYNTETVMNPAGEIQGKFGAKFDVGKNISIDKLQVSTASRLAAEASLKNVLANTKFTLKAEVGADGSKGRDVGTLGLEHSGANFSFNTDVDVIKTSVSAAALARYEGFYVGGSATLNTNIDDESKDAELSDFNAGVGYEGKDYLLTLRTANKMNRFGLALYHKYSPAVVFGVSTTFDRAASDKASLKDRTALTLGTEYRLDATSSLKAKVDSEGVISGHYSQLLRPGVKLGVSAAVDAKNLETDTHKLGFTLSVGDL